MKSICPHPSVHRQMQVATCIGHRRNRQHQLASGAGPLSNERWSALVGTLMTTNRSSIRAARRRWQRQEAARRRSRRDTLVMLIIFGLRRPNRALPDITIARHARMSLRTFRKARASLRHRGWLRYRRRRDGFVYSVGRKALARPLRPKPKAANTGHCRVIKGEETALTI
jgi:hypothetical protein